MPVISPVFPKNVNPLGKLSISKNPVKPIALILLPVPDVALACETYNKPV